MRQRYGEYLTRLKDEAYRDHVFAYVEKEDTPRPLLFQLDLLRQVGFAQVEVLHKNLCFAAFGAVKGGRHPGGTTVNLLVRTLRADHQKARFGLAVIQTTPLDL